MVADFFIWCSGGKQEILEKCPIERGKFVGMGMAVFFVSLLSCVSATFFITYAFSNKLPDPNTGELKFDLGWEYVAAGILWGLIIFTMDRNIIVSIRKTGDFKEELRMAWPRIVLAFFIGIIISTPLEMKFFEKEINQKVEENIYQEEKQKSSGDIIDLKSQIVALEKQIKNYEDDSKSAFQKAEDEKNGDGLTKIAKYGPKAKEWERKSFNYQAQADSLKPNLLDLNHKLNNKLNHSSLEALRANGTIAKYDGAEQRIKALYQLGGFHWIITLLFITLELLPLMVKLMTPRGPYDEVLDRVEYEYFIDQKRIISDKNSEINSLLNQIKELNKLKGEVRLKVEKAKLDTELAANESLFKDIAEKQASLAKIAIKKWYNQELSKLKDDPNYQLAKSKKIILPPTNTKTTPIVDCQLSNKLWKATNLNDDVYYLFKNDKATGNELVYMESGKTHIGTWDFTIPGKEITVKFLNENLVYSLEDLTIKSVNLKTLDNQIQLTTV